MDAHSEWLDQLIEALARARAMLACFCLEQPLLIAAIDAALDEAQALKQRALLP
jgi:hypothetical protein